MIGSQHIFQKATFVKELKENSFLPHKSYDLSSVGLANCITDRGWIEAHQPNSTTNSVKFYSELNYERQKTEVSSVTIVKNDRGNNHARIDPIFVDIASIEKFHIAFLV